MKKNFTTKSRRTQRKDIFEPPKRQVRQEKFIQYEQFYYSQAEMLMAESYFLS
jgi:hypothetical protein